MSEPINAYNYLPASAWTMSPDTSIAGKNRIYVCRASDGKSRPDNVGCNERSAEENGTAQNKSTTQKIVPNGIYLGAFLRDGDPTMEMVEGFQDKTGQKLDIVTFYRSFQAGFRFPSELCNELYSCGSTAFIKLEPRSFGGDQDRYFSLERINSGVFDDKIKELAKGAADFGRPVFISFAHEMNGIWYPWGGKPEEFVKAYKRVVDIFNGEGAANVTWVWNINNEGDDFRKYYPGDNYVDWIGIDGYSTDNNGNPPSASQIFGQAVCDIRKAYNKPIMIGEMAYDHSNGGTMEGKAEFLKGLPEFIKNNGIQGFVIFDHDKHEGGKERHWALNEQSEILANSMKLFQESFDTGIKTSGGTEIMPRRTAEKEEAAAESRNNSFGPWQLVGSRIVKRSGSFRSATALVYNGNIVVTSAVPTKDFGASIELADEIEGEIRFRSSGELYSGNSKEMTMQFLNQTPGNETLLSEEHFPMEKEAITRTFRMPKGTNKINIIHFGNAALSLRMTDVSIRELANNGSAPEKSGQ